jgi:hypothetical protein
MLPARSDLLNIRELHLLLRRSLAALPETLCEEGARLREQQRRRRRNRQTKTVSMMVVGRGSSSELAASRSELAARSSELAASRSELAASSSRSKLAASSSRSKLAASRSEPMTEKDFGGKRSEGRRNPGEPNPGPVTKTIPEQTPGMMRTTQSSVSRETGGTSESLPQNHCVNGAGRPKHASHSHASCVQMWPSQLDKNSCNMWMNITVACSGTATLSCPWSRSCHMSSKARKSACTPTATQSS